MGIEITDDPRVGGCLEALSRTYAGRPRGTPAISWTPCTPSVSQLCSTFTWPPSRMPSPLGVCWEMPLMGPRWVGPGEVGLREVSHYKFVILPAVSFSWEYGWTEEA
jgi:hypothetical protein